MLKHGGIFWRYRTPRARTGMRRAWAIGKWVRENGEVEEVTEYVTLSWSIPHLNFRPLFPKALKFPLSIPPISPRPCACIASLLQPSAKRTRNLRVYSIEGADLRRVQTGRKRWWIVGTICLSSDLDLMAVGHWVSWCLTNESLLRVTNTVANNPKGWWSVDEAEGRPQVAFANSNLLLQSLTKRSEHRGRDLW